MKSNVDLRKRFYRNNAIKKILKWVYVLLMLAVLYTPIIVLIMYSFNSAKVIGGQGKFTFTIYKNLFKNSDIMQATFNTLIIGLSSSLIATFIGTISAVGIYYLKKSKAAVNALNQVTIVNAEIVTAVAFMLFFVFLQNIGIPISKGFATLIIAHTVITIPYVILTVTPRLTQLDPNSFEAGMDLGASPLRSLFTVVLPQLIPGMIAGFALAFTLSMDDFAISKFNRGSIHTISTLIYTQTTKRGIDVAFRALSAIIFIVIIVGLIVFNFVKIKKQSKNKLLKGV